jgi:nitrite reductase (NAD(P)H)
MLYIRTAEKLQRTAPWVESFDGGIEKLRRILLQDELGICKDLDAEMDALIGTYEDEWKRAVQDPDLRKHFRQFANTVCPPYETVMYLRLIYQDERRDAIEMIEERGQMRAADWPKDFPGQKFDAKDLRTPKSEWKWTALATKADLSPTDVNTT